MTNETIYFIVTILFMGAIIYLQLESNISNKKRTLLFIKNVDLKNLPEISDNFSKKVIEIYKDMVLNPQTWTIENCTIYNGTDRIWTANDVCSRRFYAYTGEESKEKEYEEINKKLTQFDRILLDKLITKIKTREGEMITKFFI